MKCVCTQDNSLDECQSSSKQKLITIKTCHELEISIMDIISKLPSYIDGLNLPQRQALLILFDTHKCTCQRTLKDGSEVYSVKVSDAKKYYTIDELVSEIYNRGFTINIDIDVSEEIEKLVACKANEHKIFPLLYIDDNKKIRLNIKLFNLLFNWKHYEIINHRIKEFDDLSLQEGKCNILLKRFKLYPVSPELLVPIIPPSFITNFHIVNGEMYKKLDVIDLLLNHIKNINEVHDRCIRSDNEDTIKDNGPSLRDIKPSFNSNTNTILMYDAREDKDRLILTSDYDYSINREHTKEGKQTKLTIIVNELRPDISIIQYQEFLKSLHNKKLIEHWKYECKDINGNRSYMFLIYLSIDVLKNRTTNYNCSINSNELVKSIENLLNLRKMYLLNKVIALEDTNKIVVMNSYTDLLRNWYHKKLMYYNTLIKKYVTYYKVKYFQIAIVREFFEELLRNCPVSNSKILELVRENKTRTIKLVYSNVSEEYDFKFSDYFSYDDPKLLDTNYTQDNLDKLNRLLDIKVREIEIYSSMDPYKLWIKDLEILRKSIIDVEYLE